MHRWRRRLALGLGAWLALELTAFAGLYALYTLKGLSYEPLETRTLSPNHRKNLEQWLADSTPYAAYSSTLGWTLRPRGARGLYRANAQGLRADREYALRPSGDTTRIAAFGDSFTHGDEVGNRDTWEAALEQSASRVEVLNFGVGGFGLDQAYLRWRVEGAGFQPHVVLIGYLTENLHRHVNVYRPYYYPGTGSPRTKPRFTLQSGDLVLQPNPIARLEDYRTLLDDPASALRRFGLHDYYHQRRPHASLWDHSRIVRLIKLVRYHLVDARTEPLRNEVYNERSEAFAVTTLLFDRFVAGVRASGAIPLIVIFPTRGDFRRLTSGMPPGHQKLLDHLTEKGYDYVEALDAFPECRSACDRNTIIPSHFSPAGNRKIGEYLAGALRARGLVRR